MNESAHTSAESEAYEVGFLDFLVVIAEHLRWVVLAPIVAGGIALVITFVIPAYYTATTRIVPPLQQQSSATAALAAQLGAFSALAGGLTGIKNPADQYVAFLKSYSVYDAIIDRFNLKQVYDLRYKEDGRRELDKKVKITAGPKDGIITIEVEDWDPKRAAAIANAFVEELRRLSNTLAITEAAQRRLFFEIQLKQAKENLTNAEVALRSSGVSEAVLRTVPQAALDVLGKLKAQITAQEIKLASMRTFMTESNPEFKLAVQELTALRQELAKAQESNVSKSVGNGAEYIAKYRDFKYHETLFELMAKQYELARLDESRDAALVQVLDRAQAPERRSGPKRLTITTLTMFFALVLAIVGVLLLRAFRNMNQHPGTAGRLRQLRGAFQIRKAL